MLSTAFARNFMKQTKLSRKGRYLTAHHPYIKLVNNLPLQSLIIFNTGKRLRWMLLPYKTVILQAIFKKDLCRQSEM